MYVSEANESAKAKSANVTHMSKVKNAHEKWSAVIFYGLAQSCRRHVKGKDTLSMEGQERMTARNRLCIHKYLFDVKFSINIFKWSRLLTYHQK